MAPLFADDVALGIGDVAVFDGQTNKIGFFNKQSAPVAQQPANPDTSAATLAALETEANELKAVLRAYGLIAP